MKPVFSYACLTGAILVAAEAHAQATQVPPAQVNPGRVQQQLQPPEPERRAPEIVVPEIPGTVAPADAENTRVTVSEIRVEGSSVYPPDAFRDLTAPLAGREITLAEAFKLADAITERYRRDDYILSRAIVPAQRIENGVLRIQVVEGFVAKVNFQGQPSAAMRRYAAKLTAERPLRGKVLERYLLLMNDLAGAGARAVLAPAPDTPGGSLVTIVATRKLVDAYAGFDNHGSRYIGPFQYYAGVAANDALGLGERIAINYAGASPASELKYVNGQVDMPIGGEGLILSANAGYSDSYPGFVLKPLDARATGTSLGARLSYPVVRSRAATLRFSLAFDYLDSRTVLNHQPDFSPSSHDRVRALRLGGTYDFADAAGGHNILELVYSRGLSIFGALDENRLNPSRPNAKNDFDKLTVEVSRRQALDKLFPGLGLYGLVRAQTSFGDPLVSSEQLGIGGSVIGTAYDPSEIVGDAGIVGRIEAQYSTRVPAIRGGAQFYGFYDVGRTHNVLAQPGERHDASLSSAGGGLRFSLLGRASGYVEVAKPLTRDVQARILAKQDPRPTRVFVGMTLRY